MLMGGIALGDTAITAFTAQGVGVSTPAALTTGTVAASITATGDTAGGFKVTQTADVPTPESGWNPTGTFNYTIDGATADGTVTLYAWVMDSASVVTGPTTATISYVDGQEIDKALMTATASSSDDHPISAKVINNLPEDAWRCASNDPAPWLRLDLALPQA